MLFRHSVPVLPFLDFGEWCFYIFTFSEFSGRGFPARRVPGSFFLGWVGGGFCAFSCLPPTSVSGQVLVIGPPFVAQDTCPELWAGFR